MADYGSIAEWVAAQGGGGAAWDVTWDCGDATALDEHDFTDTEAATVNGVAVTGRYGATRADEFEINGTNGLRWSLSSAGKWGWWYGSAYTGQSQEAPRLEWQISDAIGETYDPTKHTVALQWRLDSADIAATYEKMGAFVYPTYTAPHTNVVRAVNYHDGGSMYQRITRDGSGYQVSGSLRKYGEMVVFPYGRVHARFADWPGSWPDPLTVAPVFKGGDNVQATNAVETTRFPATSAMGLFAARWSSPSGSFYANVAGWRVLKR